MHRGKDYSGRKYGLLTLIMYSRPGGQGKGSIWRAVCDCTRETEVVAKEVAAGNVRSCGKCDLLHKLRKERALSVKGLSGAYSRLYHKYRYRAYRDKVSWELTEVYFREIVQRICIYCGKEPSSRAVGTNVLVSLLERLSPTEGFHPGNVAPCCSNCSHMKNGNDSESFISKILAISDRIRLLTSSTNK